MTAVHAISLTSTGCVEAVERWTSADGRIVSDALNSYAGWAEHLELLASCPRSQPCLVGEYRLGPGPDAGPRLTGRFDDAGQLDGVWRFRDGADQHETEFVHGLGQVREWGALVKLDCVDGLVDRELVVRRTLADGRVAELRAMMDRGLRHGQFFVGVGEDTTLMAGRYEQGAPVGPWTLPTSWCADHHVGSQCGFPTCTRLGRGTTQAVCAGGCAVQPPGLAKGASEVVLPSNHHDQTVLANPGVRLAPLTCFEVLSTLVPAPGRVTTRFSAHRPSDAALELAVAE
ncbi:MAG: hypothetical protein JNJ54_18130 [Myxococcaceae bacterium]|nr:hypothetical protein [Myxococcaceae bacterium]